MNPGPEGLELSRCSSCQMAFLPSGGPCPRCAGAHRTSVTVAFTGRVLAATEIMYPATGWESPHRLALVEVAEGVRLLAIVEGEVPSSGSTVEVRADGPNYRACLSAHGPRAPGTP